MPAGFPHRTLIAYVAGGCFVIFGAGRQRPRTAKASIAAPAAGSGIDPARRVFWAWATGVSHLPAAIGIVIGVQSRLASRLLAGDAGGIRAAGLIADVMDRAACAYLVAGERCEPIADRSGLGVADCFVKLGRRRVGDSRRQR